MDGATPIRPEPIAMRSPGAMSDGALVYEGHDTLAKLFLARVAELGDRPAHMEKDLGLWQNYSWADYYRAVECVVGALSARGIRRGARLGILSENRKEWVYADMAGQCLGGIVTGIYQTDAPAQCAHILGDASVQVLFVENDEQLDKYLEIQDQVPDLSLVVVFDMDGLERFEHPRVLSWDALLAEGARFATERPKHLAEQVAQGGGDDVCILVYTSGTTGKPKGAMITNRNLIAAVIAGEHAFTTQPGQKFVSYLPLAHVYERIQGAYQHISGRLVVCYAESVETVFDNIREISPELMNGVPRVWEKVYSSVSLRMQDATRLAQALYAWGIGVGARWARYAQTGRAVPPWLMLERAAANWLVLRNVRIMVGLDGATRCLSGAAPISPDLLRWYWALGVPIFEGWGMSETVASGVVNRPGKTKVGSVGAALPGSDMRSDPDSGELQIKSDLVFVGYLNLLEKSATEFTPDGYFRTGDVGEVDAQGFVRITGRMKDIIITAGGKNVSPAELENEMKFSPYISDAVVVGDGRKYLTCLVMIDQETVEKFATDHKVAFSNFASLCAAPQVQRLIEGEIDAVNAKFARVEQIKKVRLIDQLLTAEDEELTPTLKLKRATVERKYADVIASMYTP